MPTDREAQAILIYVTAFALAIPVILNAPNLPWWYFPFAVAYVAVNVLIYRAMKP